MQAELIKYFSGFITERRLEVFEQVLAGRTRYLSVVLEDIYQSHNASAVLRSCDCFGIQDVHIIENRNEYTLSKDVTMGSNKWLNLHRYNAEGNNTLKAFEKLRRKGYRIIATSPHKHSKPISEFDLNRSKAALVFGTELDGLSETAMDNADDYIYVPMQGFTESFNISVSAAIVLYHLTGALRESEIEWELSLEEKNELMLSWLKKTVKSSDLLEKNFLDSYPNIIK